MKLSSTYMCKCIDKDQDQENQGVSACSEILDIQMQADGSLWAAFFFWWMDYLKINITVNDRPPGFNSSRENLSHFCPLVAKRAHNTHLARRYLYLVSEIPTTGWDSPPSNKECWEDERDDRDDAELSWWPQNTGMALESCFSSWPSSSVSKEVKSSPECCNSL